MNKIEKNIRANDILISHNARMFFSFLVLLSIVPLVWGLPIEYVEETYYGFGSKKLFFDYFGIILAPIISSIGLVCGAYRSSIIPVLFMYFVDIFWLFNPGLDHYNIWNLVYSLVCVISLCGLYHILRNVSFIQDQNHIRAKAEIDKIEEKRIAIENDSKKLEEMIEKLESQA